MKENKLTRKEVMQKRRMQKVELLKKLIGDIFPGIETDQMMLMIGRCAHYRLGDRDHLSQDERILHDCLLKNQFNPSTVYKWFRLSIVPEDVKKRLEDGTLTQRQALRLSTNRRHQREVNLGWQFIETCRNVVRGALRE